MNILSQKGVGPSLVATKNFLSFTRAIEKVLCASKTATASAAMDSTGTRTNWK